MISNTVQYHCSDEQSTKVQYVVQYCPLYCNTVQQTVKQGTSLIYVVCTVHYKGVDIDVQYTTDIQYIRDVQYITEVLRAEADAGGNQSSPPSMSRSQHATLKLLNTTGLILNTTGIILNTTGLVLNTTGIILNAQTERYWAGLSLLNTTGLDLTELYSYILDLLNTTGLNHYTDNV